MYNVSIYSFKKKCPCECCKQKKEPFKYCYNIPIQNYFILQNINKKNMSLELAKHICTQAQNES